MRVAAAEAMRDGANRQQLVQHIRVALLAEGDHCAAGRDTDILRHHARHAGVVTCRGLDRGQHFAGGVEASRTDKGDDGMQVVEGIVTVLDRGLVGPQLRDSFPARSRLDTLQKQSPQQRAGVQHLQ